MSDVDECADPHLNNCSRYLSYENGRSTHEKMGCKNTKGSYECYSIKNTRLRIKGIIIGVSTGVGVPFLLICGWGSYKGLKKRKMMKRKEKFFKRNGGLLLQQQLSSSEVNVGNPNLFTSKDLEKATDHFNVNRILGQGGQGTVYKAMLPDGKIIAVKKSKLLTGEKAIFSTIVQETKGLAAYFTDSMEENNLLNIIDNRVLEDGEKEEIIVVANLTRRCLNVSGRERPTMKEVATELEAVQVLRKATNHRLCNNVDEDAKTEMYEAWDVSASRMLSMDRNESSSLDA
ncbi:putative wall-associated receptor kinase-like 13 [Morella rubra]|uniref:Putative wall-associated receptor kinase-like 13 n=1 Tax=Morella rubra TaxID=262757 RepID=A0A6A1UKZ4_9ROSI|nr:putative wall-associated receptor kinase-like 13 [Morella rubra]